MNDDRFLQSLSEDLEGIAADPRTIARIEEQLTQNLKPVRPLPSTFVLTLALFGLFLGFSALATLPFGYAGFHALTTIQKLQYYPWIALLAWFLAAICAWQMVPGSKSPMWHPFRDLLLGFVVLIFYLVLTFANFDLNRFVHQGIPCLRLGCICALVSGTLMWLILRRGFFTTPVVGAANAGLFAGLIGFAVLALHCPIENAAHILVWHLGSVILGGLAGALIGRWQTRGSIAGS